jgi:GST-like protein
MAVLAGRQSGADGRAAQPFRQLRARRALLLAQALADEYNRCLGVLERRLGGREFILGEYSIAGMASWRWVLIAKPLGQPLEDFPNVARWRETIKQRPAVQRGVDLGK